MDWLRELFMFKYRWPILNDNQISTVDGTLAYDIKFEWQREYFQLFPKLKPPYLTSLSLAKMSTQNVSLSKRKIKRSVSQRLTHKSLSSFWTVANIAALHKWISEYRRTVKSNWMQFSNFWLQKCVKMWLCRGNKLLSFCMNLKSCFVKFRWSDYLTAS